MTKQFDWKTQLPQTDTIRKMRHKHTHTDRQVHQKDHTKTRQDEDHEEGR